MSVAKHNKRNRRGKIYLSHSDWKRDTKDYEYKEAMKKMYEYYKYYYDKYNK